MIDITVQLKRADGGSSAYAAILRDGTDRSIHEVVVPHSVGARYEQGFDSSSAMIERLFELLLDEEPPESIRSSFDIRDLFLHRPHLESMLLERSEGEVESLGEWLTTSGSGGE
jgi:hypothetical protein